MHVRQGEPDPGDDASTVAPLLGTSASATTTLPIQRGAGTTASAVTATVSCRVVEALRKLRGRESCSRAREAVSLEVYAWIHATLNPPAYADRFTKSL